MPCPESRRSPESSWGNCRGFTRKRAFNFGKYFEASILANGIKKELNLYVQVQQEVLRLHSPANLIYRLLTKDVEYKGYILPKGWLVIPNFISIHRDSQTFEDELKFDPERWNTGKPYAIQKLYWCIRLYSFGAGIHQCLGRNIALLEGKLLVVLLARNYDWELPPQVMQ